jgi:hypothetical protein
MDVSDNNLELDLGAQERTDALVDELIKEKAELEKVHLFKSFFDTDLMLSCIASQSSLG